MGPIEAAVDDVLRRAGGETFCEAYGLEKNGSLLSTIVRGQYPSALSPETKKTAIAGMQPALIVASPGHLAIYAGIHKDPGTKAGIEMRPAQVLTPSHNYPTRGFADILIDAMNGPRPMVVFSTGRSVARALSRPRITMDPRVVKAGGEVDIEADATRVAHIIDILAETGVSKIHHLRAFIEKHQRTTPGHVLDARTQSEDGLKAVGKLCGKKGKFDTADPAIANALDAFADLPDIRDPAWSIAARLIETERSTADILPGDLS